MNIQYTWFTFAELSRHELYEILRLRQQVFIIEQASLYPDIDGNDPIAQHLIAREDNQKLIGYLRLLPPGTTNRRPAIGRLAIAKPFRGLKMGNRLMTEGIRMAGKLYADCAIYISAQQHLMPFYGDLGFVSRGEPYDEDGILHIDMIRPAPEAG